MIIFKCKSTTYNFQVIIHGKYIQNNESTKNVSKKCKCSMDGDDDIVDVIMCLLKLFKNYNCINYQNVMQTSVVRVSLQSTVYIYV